MRSGTCARHLKPIINAAWEAEDGCRRLTTLELPAVPYAQQAQQLGNELIQDERRFRQHGVTLPPEYFFLEPLDAFGWTSAWNSYSDKLFEIAEAAYDLRRLSRTRTCPSSRR